VPRTWPSLVPPRPPPFSCPESADLFGRCLAGLDRPYPRGPFHFFPFSVEWPVGAQPDDVPPPGGNPCSGSLGFPPPEFPPTQIPDKFPKAVFPAPPRIPSEVGKDREKPLPLPAQAPGGFRLRLRCSAPPPTMGICPFPSPPFPWSLAFCTPSFLPPPHGASRPQRRVQRPLFFFGLE